MKISRLLVVLVGAATLLAAGCGGGHGGGPVSLSGTGEITSSDRQLSDGTHYDTVCFTATRNGTVEVRMETTADPSLSVDDPFLLIALGCTTTPTSSSVIASDDDSGVGPNARCLFAATRGQAYTVILNTYDVGDVGWYRYTIDEVVSTSAVVDTTAQKGKSATRVIGLATKVSE